MAHWIAENLINKSPGADASRLPHSDLPTENAGLTQYEEIVTPEVTTEVAFESTSLFDLTEYLPSQEANAILTRSYQIDEFGWTVAQASGTPLGLYRLPKVLWDQSWIKNVMGAYKYFRCAAIEISFRIQSTSMHQGALNISHVYNEKSSDPDSARGTFARRRNNRPLLFSAMPGNSQVIRIPWNNPEQWAYTSDVASDAFNIGVVDVDVLVPLTTVAPIVTSAMISVYANFVKPELAGPSLFVTQGNGKNKPASVAESVSKAAKGVTDITTTIVNAVDSVVSLASTALPIAALVLDKPTDSSAPTPSYNAFGSGQLGIEGTAPEITLGAGQLVTLSQQAGTMGPGVPNPSLHSCLATPGYLDYRTFNNASVKYSWSVGPMVHWPPSVNFTQEPTFLGYFSMPFRYWRGAITYQIFFFCSTFTSARFRITWTPDTNGAVNVAGQQGNIMSKVVEVRGDTMTTVTIPYAKPALWSEVHVPGEQYRYRDHANGVIQIDRINASSVVADPLISAVLYVHGGPDYQVGRYRSKMFNTSLVSGETRRKFVIQGEPGESNSAFIWDYTDASDPISGATGLEVSGYAQAEQYSDICSLFKRMHATLPTPITFLPPTLASYLDGSEDPVNQMLNCFKYFRGSVRMQFVRDSSAVNRWATIGCDSATLTGNPGGFGLVLRTKLPWFSRYPFLRVTGFSGHPDIWISYLDEIVSSPKGLWSFGDDVGVSGLFSPPELQSTVNP